MMVHQDRRDDGSATFRRTDKGSGKSDKSHGALARHMRETGWFERLFA